MRIAWFRRPFLLCNIYNTYIIYRHGIVIVPREMPVNVMLRPTAVRILNVHVYATVGKIHRSATLAETGNNKTVRHRWHTTDHER